MALNLFQKIINKLLKEFQLANGRSPQTPQEYVQIQNEAVRVINQTKGAPPITKKTPFQGFTPKVIEGGKGEIPVTIGGKRQNMSPAGILEAVIKSGDVQKGVAPKTTPRKPGLDEITQKEVIKEQWIADKKRQNKEAIERFKEKTKTVEDFTKEGDWDPSGFAQGGIAPLVGEPTYAADFYDDRVPYANGGNLQQLIQMYMEEGLTYEEAVQAAQSSSNLNMDMLKRAHGGRAMFHGGGSVGRPPITSGIQSDTPQQQMGVIMGQGPSIMERQQQAMAQNPYMMKGNQPQAQGAGIPGQGPRMKMEKGGMSRRGFLKIMGGLSALPFIGKYIKGAKTAAPAAEAAVESIRRTAGGIPEYAYDLIEVVKNKGLMEIMEGIYKRNPPSKKYTYKGVEVIDDGLGNVSVRKPQTKTGSWTDEAADDTIVDDYVDREVGFEIRKGEDVVKDGKAVKAGDEYNESTAYMQGDPDGGMDVSEVLEVIDDADHLDLKKIADEATTEFDKFSKIRKKKASGGMAYLLGE